MPKDKEIVARKKRPIILTRGSGAGYAGFTLLDVTIVAVILGVAVVAGLPVLSSGLNDARLSAAAGEVVGALEFARVRALSSGLPTRVTVDAAADTLAVERFVPAVDLTGSHVELPENQVESGAFAPLMHPLDRGRDYAIRLADSTWFSGADVAQVDLGGGNTVVFQGAGSPSAGGSVTLTAGRFKAVVLLDALTGKVKVNM
jgi:type II secretory pathway pseudopilin PulG